MPESFEDYFYSEEKREIFLPLNLYRMMQFMDFSFHENERDYANSIKSFESHNFGTIYSYKKSDKIIYKDFIDTYKLMFDV